VVVIVCASAFQPDQDASLYDFSSDLIDVLFSCYPGTELAWYDSSKIFVSSCSEFDIV